MRALKMPALNVDIAAVIKEAEHLGVGVVIDWNSGIIATSNRDKWAFEIRLDWVKEGFSPVDGKMILTFHFTAKAPESHRKAYRKWMQDKGERVWGRYIKRVLRTDVPSCYAMYVGLDYYGWDEIEEQEESA